MDDVGEAVIFPQSAGHNIAGGRKFTVAGKAGAIKESRHSTGEP